MSDMGNIKRERESYEKLRALKLYRVSPACVPHQKLSLYLKQ